MKIIDKDKDKALIKNTQKGIFGLPEMFICK